MKRLSEYLFIWTLGGCLYYTFELIFRGFSHWTMFVLGGICMEFIWLQGASLDWKDPLWLQLLRCMIFITAMEFISGIVLNKWLHLHIWDYSRLPFELFGQICLPFVVIFSGLSCLGIFLSGYLMHWLYQEPMPHYTVF